MSYVTTWTFAEETIAPNETLQLVLEFTHSYAPAAGDFAAPDGVRIMSWGKNEVSYDLEDALLAIGEMSFGFGDENGDLDNWFFGTTQPGTTTDKKAKVTVLYNSLTKTDQIVFVGKIIEDSITSNTSMHTVGFKASSDTDIFNKKMVFDETTPLDPLDLGAATIISLPSLLEKFYQLVDSTISFTGGSLVINHNWLFNGQSTSPIDGNVWLNEILVEELNLSANYLFFADAAGIVTCGDVLKLIAKRFCSFTGIYNGTAFLNKLFYYNASNLQTPVVMAFEKGYRYGTLDYVRAISHFGYAETKYEEPSAAAFSKMTDRMMEIDLPEEPLTASVTRSNIFYIYCTGITVTPANGATYIDGYGLGTYEIVGGEIVAGTGYLTCKILTGTVPAASGYISKLTETGDANITYNPRYTPLDLDFNTTTVFDPVINPSSYIALGSMVAKFWYNFRGNIANCRVDKFVFRGVDYDFLKSFNYGGYKYQIIKLTIDYTNHTSDVEAIYLGAV